eukprot:CAMPEP_0171465632 /NCGR_PEP_ID=MMETSP0945-20130129/8651_1 /TAXON_ID=109269 /ORGANISM="Vaucheria litorea, Strain CCMP2940" /LENGTH=445 /DNA_ID=CAMNT_0011993315 /DNA_START=54 /DNA_END=1388 /DNA_ORIENTATION=-
MALPSNISLAELQKKKQQHIQQQNPKNDQIELSTSSSSTIPNLCYLQKEPISPINAMQHNNASMLHQYMSRDPQFLPIHPSHNIFQQQDQQKMLYQRMFQDQMIHQQEMSKNNQIKKLQQRKQMQLNLRQQQHIQKQQQIYQNQHFKDQIKSMPDSISLQNPSSIALKGQMLACYENNSEFKGVRFESNKWSATFSLNGENVNLGLFDSKESAAKMYDAYAIAKLGEKAVVNFPNDILFDRISGNILRIRDAMTGKERSFNPGSSPRFSHSNKMPQNLPEAKKCKKIKLAEPNLLIFTAANEIATANAFDHNLTCSYEVSFPKAGTLGLNLRRVQIHLGARARSHQVQYIVEVKDVQQKFLQTVIQPHDVILSVNKTKLYGSEGMTFENSISLLNNAPLPRIIRFARVRTLSSLELQLTLKTSPCALFEISEENQPSLITAKLDP